MRAPRAVLVLLITGLLGALAVAFAPASAAGGPTSVLLVDPGSRRATALYTTDARYQQLSDLIGATEPPRNDGSPPGLTDGTWTPGSGGITVTWLIHDVAIWRIDHVYLTRDDSVWIGSVTDMGGPSGLNQKPAWHLASEPKALTALLTGLGLGPLAVPTASSAPAPASTSVAAAPRPAAAPAPAAVPGPLWGLGGLVVGAGAVLIALTILGLGRFRRRPPEEDDDVEVPASAEVLQG